MNCQKLGTPIATCYIHTHTHCTRLMRSGECLHAEAWGHCPLLVCLCCMLPVWLPGGCLPTNCTNGYWELTYLHAKVCHYYWSCRGCHCCPACPLLRSMGFRKANPADRWLCRSIQVSRVSGTKVAGWDLCVGELLMVDVGGNGLFN